MPIAADKPRTALIIPAFNEARSIAEIVGRARELVPEFDVLVIDDGSRDDTAVLARAAGARVASHPFNLGYGAALQTGYKWALAQGYDEVVQMDADGQHDPAFLRQLVEPLRTGQADLVIGSRFLAESGYQMDAARKTGRLFLQRLLRLCGGPTIADPTSGLQALRRPVFEFCCNNFYPVDFPDVDVLLLLHRRGFRVLEVPVRMAPSPLGRKTMHAGLKAFYYPYKMLLSTLRSWRLAAAPGDRR